MYILQQDGRYYGVFADNVLIAQVDLLGASDDHIDLFKKLVDDANRGLPRWHSNDKAWGVTCMAKHAGPFFSVQGVGLVQDGWVRCDTCGYILREDQIPHKTDDTPGNYDTDVHA